MKRLAAMMLVGVLVLGGGMLGGCMPAVRGRQAPQPQAQHHTDTHHNSMKNAPINDSIDGDSSSTSLSGIIPGTYEVPSGWVLVDEHSSTDKLFYAQKGYEEEDIPDNVSVEVGTNHYSKDQHEAFRQAILRQLSQQASEVGAQVQGSGQTTRTGNTLYVFTVQGNTNMTTTFFYIVGDYQYCLMQATDIDGSSAAATAAQEMADTFVWDD